MAQLRRGRRGGVGEGSGSHGRVDCSRRARARRGAVQEDRRPSYRAWIAGANGKRTLLVRRSGRRGAGRSATGLGRQLASRGMEHLAARAPAAAASRARSRSPACRSDARSVSRGDLDRGRGDRLGRTLAAAGEGDHELRIQGQAAGAGEAVHLPDGLHRRLCSGGRWSAACPPCGRGARGRRGAPGAARGSARPRSGAGCPAAGARRTARPRWRAACTSARARDSARGCPSPRTPVARAMKVRSTGTVSRASSKASGAW